MDYYLNKFKGDEFAIGRWQNGIRRLGLPFCAQIWIGLSNYFELILPFN